MKKWEDPAYVEGSKLRSDIARAKQQLENAERKYREFKARQRVETATKQC
jgi:hypothetical protein